MRSLDRADSPESALVEQMHQQLVSSVDALELQLRRNSMKATAGPSATPIRPRFPPAIAIRSPNTIANFPAAAASLRWGSLQAAAGPRAESLPTQWVKS